MMYFQCILLAHSLYVVKGHWGVGYNDTTTRAIKASQCEMGIWMGALEPGPKKKNLLLVIALFNHVTHHGVQGPHGGGLEPLNIISL